MAVFLVTAVIVTRITVSIAVSRLSAVASLFPVIALTLCSAFGYLASFEPGVSSPWKIMYATGAIASISTGCCVVHRHIWKKQIS